MKAETTIQYLLDFYPTIFPTRKHVLQHLFCTIGNGYYWENGELLCVDDGTYKMGRYKITILVEPEEKVYAQNENVWWMLWKVENDKNIKVGLRKYYFEWSKPDEDWRLYSTPNDIKQDWLDILTETIQYLKEDGIDISTYITDNSILKNLI